MNWMWLSPFNNVKAYFTDIFIKWGYNIPFYILRHLQVIADYRK